MLSVAEITHEYGDTIRLSRSILVEYERLIVDSDDMGVCPYCLDGIRDLMSHLFTHYVKICNEIRLMDKVHGVNINECDEMYFVSRNLNVLTLGAYRAYSLIVIANGNPDFIGLEEIRCVAEDLVSLEEVLADCVMSYLDFIGGSHEDECRHSR